MRNAYLAVTISAAALLAACAPATPPASDGTPTPTPTSTPPAAVVDPTGNLAFTIQPLAGWIGDNTCAADAMAKNCGLVLANNRYTLEIIESPKLTAGDDGYLLPTSAAATSTEAVTWVRTLGRGYQRTDRYLGRPDGQFVWAGSVFSGTAGRVLHPTGGARPTFSIRAVYRREVPELAEVSPLAGLPVRGSEELEAMLVEVNRMVESLQLKP